MLENMHEIGQVKQVQAQPSALKLGSRPHKYYDPTPLLIVKSLLISPEGIIGVNTDGNEVLDVHHIQHPKSRNIEGKNGVSIGFTSHYQNIRNRLNPELKDGCAGENILVETDCSFTLGDLGKLIAIQSAATGNILYLARLMVAAPCVEFTQYAANAGMPLPPQELQAALKFLDKGQRGFYATPANSKAQMSVEAGDKVFVGSEG